MVAAGVVYGLWLAMRRAPKFGLDAEMVSRLTTWILLGGFAGARLMHVFAYRWVDYQDNLLDIVKAWEGGMSSYGGFIGAAVGGVTFLLRAKLPFWRYADVMSFAFIPGWTIGRIGCFLIHDHPGSKSDFFLAAEMRNVVEVGDHYQIDVSARHDLGMYDGILSLGIWIFFVLADRKPRYAGFFLGWMCVLYAVPRFFLDHLRAIDLAVNDARYAGLTPAQYGSIVLLLLGGWIIWSRRRTPIHTT
ncbi:MAG: phosphatidylglycerol:prolipoprotein diacylglycerol transferase [Myxococcota bacterium]|jgi:phosphatidylglycerol:prolipoprotein diacylglycerol transferase